jgi:hypothetical protein
MFIDSSKARIFLDMHLPAWPEKGVASAFDPGRIAEKIRESGADSVVLYAKCQYGNFYTRMDGERLHPGLGNTDLFEELAARLRPGGVKVIAYYSVAWDERIAAEHPEWLTVGSEGKRGESGLRWKTLCINSPYAEIVKRHVRQLASKPTDGIWIDMTIIGDGNCRCVHCADKFRGAVGKPIPAGNEDPLFDRFVEFRYDCVEALYGEIAGIVRSVNGGIALTNNYWGYPYSSPGMGSRAVGAVKSADFITGEAYSDWTGIRASSFFPIFLRGVACGRPYETLISRSINTWDYTRKPAAFLSYEAFAVFSHGATVTINDQPSYDGRIDEELYEHDFKNIFAEIAAMERTVRGGFPRYAAVYHSQKTKDSHPEPLAFVRNISGAFRLLHDLHLPVDFIFDECVSAESLSDIQVLLLPSVSTVSAEEWRLFKAYIERGGCVIAAGEIGSPGGLTNPLEDIFNITEGEVSPFSISYARCPEWGERNVLVRGNFRSYRAGSGTYGMIVNPICETGDAEFFHNNLPSPYQPSGIPWMIERALGAGRFILFPQPLFFHYAKEPSREIRGMIGGAISRSVPPFPIALEIPLKMDYSIVRSGDDFYVHLLNPNVEPTLCCGLMDTTDGNFERSYEYMEEPVPVPDLRMVVRGKKVRAVETLRERAPFTVRVSGAETLITVSRVVLWEVVRISVERDG